MSMVLCEAVAALSEPLLLVANDSSKPLSSSSSSVNTTTITTTAHQHGNHGTTLALWGAAFFVAGILVAAVSQCVLFATLWTDAVMEEAPLWYVILFSLRWSFWACLTILGALLLLVRVAEPRLAHMAAYHHHPPNASDTVLPHLEVVYVIGALSTIAAVWLLGADGEPQLYALMVCRYLAVSMAVAFATLLVVLSAHHRPQLPSRHIFALPQRSTLVASTAGLLAGAGSQFVLTQLLWKSGDMTEPMVNSITLFSLLWSALTVVLTASCCAITVQMYHTFGIKKSIEGGCAHLTVLRMEAAFVGASLGGICAAWVIMDIMHGALQQVVPSLLLLMVSLASFTVVLQCFPEDQCCCMCYSADETTPSTRHASQIQIV